MTVLFVHGPVSLLIEPNATYDDILAALCSMAEVLARLSLDPDALTTRPGVPNDGPPEGPAGQPPDDRGGSPVH